MPEITAFRAIRYDLGHVGSLSDVVAPPYDVINQEQQDALYKRHPANVIRLILNRDEPGDDETSNRYTRAARYLKNWQSEGLLFTEPDPALYVYHQQFRVGDHSFVRRGFMCRVRLERFGEGTIFPHEETMPGPKQDRLNLMRACRANLSPVFGLFPDEENAVQQKLEQAVQGQTPIEATDDLGVVHRMWPVTDIDTIRDVAALMGPKSVYIADGHHRYETACTYRDELAEQLGELPPQHPANFALMMFVGMSDPGMIVLPTHRLFRGFDAIRSEDLAARLAPDFEAEVVAKGPESAQKVWSVIAEEDRQDVLGLYAAADAKWLLARLTDRGRAHMERIAPEHCTAWRGLGVSILHGLVIETLLDLTPAERPAYVHLIEEVASGLQKGNYPLAALVMPATLEHIRQISQEGERMPAKSTYFYPKLLSGLVINPLE